MKTFKGLAGDHIDEVIANMIYLANEEEERIYTNFNGVRFIVTPGDEFGEIKAEYQEKLGDLIEEKYD